LHKYTATGNYSVKLTATAPGGCKDSIVQTLTVNGDKPVAAFSFENTGNLCSNLPVQIRNQSTVNFGSITRVVVYWNVGLNNQDSTEDLNPAAGKIYTKQYPVFSTPVSRQITIKFVAYSGGICVNETSKVFTLYSNPIANFQATPANGCLGEPVQFTDQSISASNNITGWNWLFGDGSTSNLQNPAHEYTDAGNFSVSLHSTTSAGCSSDTSEKQVTVYPIPVVNAGPDLVVLQGGQVILRGEVSGSSGYTYLWEPATWLNDPTVLQPISRAEADINYTLKVTGEGGCAESDEVFVQLLLKPIIPNAFSPNGDGINETWVIRYLDSYPGATVQVFDRYGKRVLMSTGYNNPWNGTMGGSPVPAGVYYYIVTPKNGLQPITGSVTIIR
jgi:gliding motility-associated-like protein